ncbi:MAG: 4-aminobutyrate--2-oxoglutarate transaminase [Gammaproteobacteria bacterium]|nr:4-aminobutyrate--2-oxoglutarate transaminase [Gammaproteobacteria bacterium]MBI5617809.1 4-aminobutyrate--2-oxoglutarate transaminase [Gammaproteobacteria bacterium]
MSTNAELMQRRQQAIPRGIGNLHTRFLAKAENAELWDVEGRRYIDFAAGIAVVNTGHRNPTVVARVADQLQRYTHTCFNVMAYEPYVELAEKLNRLAPGPTPKKTMLVTTGAEAIENAVKIARAHTRRSSIIAFGGGFHGRTLLTMSLTGKVDPYKTGFGPFVPEVFHALFPNALHGISVEQALASVEKLFKYDVEPSRVAAIIVEPVQGEGGFYIAPPEFLQGLRALCDKHGIVFIVDEVQTGFARTGRFFASEYAGVEADLLPLAKGLGGGLPLSAVVGKAEIMDAPAPGGLGGTYAGNPLACAAALGVIEAIEADKLVARSQAIGERLVARLRELATRHPCIAEVRGLGAMVAMEFMKDRAKLEPDADIVKAILAKAAEKGLILLSCGTYGNVVRILVPLTISDALLDEGLGILAATLAELAPAA